MPQLTLTGLRVAILATDGFEQSELLEPKRALDAAGAQTQVIAPLKNGDIRGWSQKEWGDTVHVDQALHNAKPGEYDALVLPGGVMNPDSLRMQPEAVAHQSLLFKTEAAP